MRGDLKHVLENRMVSLGNDIINTTPTEQIYRIQGQMQMLIEVMHLQEKARMQINKQ